MALAISSLPVPLSPVINTVASVGAILFSRSMTFFIRALAQTISSKPNRSSRRRFSSRLSRRRRTVSAALPVVTLRPFGVIGFSMGASLALWLSARLTQEVGSVVAFYGTQSIDFDDATAVYQGHYAEDDHIVTEEDRVVTESFIRLGGRDTDFHLYPGTQHWFFEEGENYDPEAAELAWERVESFLSETVGSTA